MQVDRFFSQSDLREIERAVQHGENRSAGEIVPYVVGSSDSYSEANWKGASLGGLLAALASAFVHEMGGFWGGWFAAWVMVPPIVGGALGYLAATLIPGVRRRLVSDEAVERRVRLRAQAAFLHEEIFKTRERTGILIFLSLFERRVIVLADSGINAKVQQEDWDGIVDGIVKGIRAGRPGEALRVGIEGCARLLARHGVAIRADDEDELADRLRMEDR